MFIPSFITTIYEKFAYHVTYEIDDKGVITKIERNNKLNIGHFNTIAITLLSIFVFVFVFGLTSHEIHQRNKEKLYLETFYVNQLCYEGDELSECYSISKYNGIKIFIDEREGIKTLFISGE